ncbi:MAG TPA: thiamine-phosphate kinase [Terriglobia bacterium]|nr:thiamine-phosphate kinase [Terriglobia bacterium]
MYTTAKMIFQSEDEFVQWLRGLASAKSPQVRMGIGDDAALVRVRKGRDLILTVDLSIEGVHFTPGLHPARSIGYRALARSLSDVAAMGGVPRFALVSVAFPRSVSRAWIGEFYGGVLDLAARFHVELIGGDTSVVRRTAMVDVVLAGEIIRGRGLLRSGARPGDVIFVSGSLGQSARGLEILRRQARHPKQGRRSKQENSETANAVKSHLYPEPRCELGHWLQQAGIPSAMMDISDGLSTDLVRLCEASRTGAKVDAWRIPRVEAISPKHSLELALNGGEDYELLFTVPKSRIAKVPRSHSGVSLQPIGTISRPREVLLVHENGRCSTLTPAGYDHFSR